MEKVEFRKIQVKPREAAFLHKWLKRKGLRYIDTHKHIPLVILQEYEKDLNAHTYTFNDYYNSEDRAEIIRQHIDFVLNVRPMYLKVLLLANLNCSQVGLLMGYKTANSWHASYKRVTYIRGIVAVYNAIGDNLKELPYFRTRRL